MDIPSYDKTVCPYCRKNEICNKDRFKEKIKHCKDYSSEIKYSYCDYYEYRNKETTL